MFSSNVRGQWQLGRRNGDVTFTLQPLINRVGAALALHPVSVAVMISGVNRAINRDGVAPAACS